MIFPVKITKFKNGKPAKPKEISAKTLIKRHWEEAENKPTPNKREQSFMNCIVRDQEAE
jgi:hypothetical protein